MFVISHTKIVNVVLSYHRHTCIIYHEIRSTHLKHLMANGWEKNLGETIACDRQMGSHHFIERFALIQWDEVTSGLYFFFPSTSCPEVASPHWVRVGHSIWWWLLNGRLHHIWWCNCLTKIFLNGWANWWQCIDTSQSLALKMARDTRPLSKKNLAKWSYWSGFDDYLSKI